MAKVDDIFKEMCEDILTTGTTTEGQKVRPIWTDTNEPAYTIKKFGVVNTYDLREEFPALTLRKTAIKTAIDEVLWIYQKQSNNVNDLKGHIWDSWADETGSIGEAYGYQIGKEYIHHGDVKMNQMDAVLYDLKHNPFSRRIMTNMYCMEDLHNMHLHPCAYSMTFNVTDEGDDKLVLNAVLNQRSQDVLAANNWNVVQYSALLMMVAQVSNMIPGKLMHVIADAHIYDRHVPMVKELLSRHGDLKAPRVTLDQTITDFYQFTTDSFTVEDYQVAGDQIRNIPIAV